MVEALNRAEALKSAFLHVAISLIRPFNWKWRKQVNDFKINDYNI